MAQKKEDDVEKKIRALLKIHEIDHFILITDTAVQVDHHIHITDTVAFQAIYTNLHLLARSLETQYLEQMNERKRDDQ